MVKARLHIYSMMRHDKAQYQKRMLVSIDSTPPKQACRQQQQQPCHTQAHVQAGAQSPAPCKQNVTKTGWTSSSVPTQRFHSGMAMCVFMEGLMSNSADTTCTSTSTCRPPAARAVSCLQRCGENPETLKPIPRSFNGALCWALHSWSDPNPESRCKAFVTCMLCLCPCITMQGDEHALPPSGTALQACMRRTSAVRSCSHAGLYSTEAHHTMRRPASTNLLPSRVTPTGVKLLHRRTVLPHCLWQRALLTVPGKLNKMTTWLLVPHAKPLLNDLSLYRPRVPVNAAHPLLYLVLQECCRTCWQGPLATDARYTSISTCSLRSMPFLPRLVTISRSFLLTISYVICVGSMLRILSCAPRPPAQPCNNPAAPRPETRKTGP